MSACRRHVLLTDYPHTHRLLFPKTFPASPLCLLPHSGVSVCPDLYQLSRQSYLTTLLSNNEMIFQFHLQMLLSAMLKAVRRRVKPSTAHTFFLLIVIFYPALNPSNLGKDLNLIKS